MCLKYLANRQLSSTLARKGTVIRLPSVQWPRTREALRLSHVTQGVSGLQDLPTGSTPLPATPRRQSTDEEEDAYVAPPVSEWAHDPLLMMG